MERSTETVRDDPEGLRPRPPRPRDLPGHRPPRWTTTPRPRSTGTSAAASRPRSWPTSSAGPARASTASSTRCGRRRILGVKLEFMPHPSFDDAVGRTPRSSARCPARPTARPRARPKAPKGLPAVPGQPLRGPPAGPRAGGPPVPQDELPEVPGRPAPRGARPGQGPDRRPRRDRAAPGRGPGRQEPDHPRQPPPGRLDRQAARRPVEQLLRAGLRRQHVADPRRREVRLRPRQQVQHVRLAGRS